MPAYVDTSALAKWYVREPASEEFERWILAVPTPTICSLAFVELRCLLARRRTAGTLDAESESRAYAAFQQDIDRRHLVVTPLEDADVRSGAHLMERVGAHPLRALDAIHLAVCTSREISLLATADVVMAAAAEDLGIEVVRFDCREEPLVGG